jgi:biotin transport system substrate-specific component
MLESYFYHSPIPYLKGNATFLSALQVLGASSLLALCAQISIPLYFSPVPLSGQTFGIMLIGALLGSRKGLLSVLTYCTEGAMGLPVFAGSSFGLFTLLGPTGGYFLGFAFQVYIVGRILERQRTFQWPKVVATLTLSCIIQISSGVLWLSYFVGLPSAMAMGFYPFVWGEAVKIIVLALFLRQIQ